MKKILYKFLIILFSINILCGCKSNSKIKVIFYDEYDEICQISYVSLTQNANCPELRYPKEGYKFRGWTYTKGEKQQIRPGESVFWKNVKNTAVDNEICLYAVWNQEAELKIAYDAYTQENATSPLSGINSKILSRIKTGLGEYLDEKVGFHVTIDYQPFTEQAIEDKTQRIKNAGNYDIAIGFATTINTPSGGALNITKINKNYTNILGKERTLASLNNKDITNFAYDWLNDPYSLNHDRTSTEYDLVVGWGWNGNYGSSPQTAVIDYQVWNNVENNLKNYLVSQGYDNVKLLTRPYRNSPAYTCGQNVNNDGDVDILVGFGSNISDYGTEKNCGNVDIYKFSSQLKIKVNDETSYSRYVYQLNLGSDIVNCAYDWFLSEDGKNSFNRQEHKTIKIGIDRRSSASGITDAIEQSYKDGLATYLTNNSLNYVIEYEDITYTQAPNNTELVTYLLNNNFDIYIGTADTTGVFGDSRFTFTLSKQVKINSKSGKRILALDNYEEVKTIYNYTTSETGLTSLSAE